MNFTCPHCGVAQIATEAVRGVGVKAVSVGKFSECVPKEGHETGLLAIQVAAVSCANSECNKSTIAVSAGTTNSYDARILNDGSVFASTRLYPPSKGKPFPVGVPDTILEDYNEAWAIVELSPKSSATLARRCLQAMIRDFCQIKERTLFHEIEKLEALLAEDALPKGVEFETIAAMKAVKDVGNIGAHMTEDGGKIVSVEKGEAKALLVLIEMLFQDWYVAQYKRKQNLAEIVKLGAQKKPRSGDGRPTIDQGKLG